MVLGAAALIGWFYLSPRIMPQAPTSPDTAEVQAANPASTATNQAAAANATAETVKPVTAVVMANLPEVVLKNQDAKYSIQPVTGAITKVVFSDKFHKKDSNEPIAINMVDGALGLRGENCTINTVKVLSSKLTQDGKYLLSRLMRDSFGNEFTVNSEYALQGKYQLQLKMQIKNSSQREMMLPALLIPAGGLQQWHRLSGDAASRAQELHTVEYCTVSGKVKNENANADNDDWNELNGQPVRWMGVANRFFAQLLKGGENLQMQLDRTVAEPGAADYNVFVSGKMDSGKLTVGGTKDVQIYYYLGPKQPKALRDFDKAGSKVMHLGWFPIDFLAYIMLAVLNWLYSFVGSFGWSIILLTLLVRTLFFPITMKANASMREMSALSPKLKEIREKYKDEPMVAQSKMQELYREHKVNPVSGCLPMLIQIPVFIALYYALGSAAELRMQSFWWIKDLAQPDTVAVIFGLPLNPLIIVWTLLMVVQQKLTPTAMDPTQAKVMLIMPLVMLFFLYTLPAALTLYWTTSQIYSIAQMLYQNKLKKRDESRRASDSDSKPAAKPRAVRS